MASVILANPVRAAEPAATGAAMADRILFVPDRNFAFVILTNPVGGPKLVGAICMDDGVLSRALVDASGCPPTLQRRAAPAA